MANTVIAHTVLSLSAGVPTSDELAYKGTWCCTPLVRSKGPLNS